jgi:hypothetical protein
LQDEPPIEISGKHNNISPKEQRKQPKAEEWFEQWQQSYICSETFDSGIYGIHIDHLFHSFLKFNTNMHGTKASPLTSSAAPKYLASVIRLAVTGKLSHTAD